MCTIANDVIDVREGPSLKEQATILQEICALANDAEEIGDSFSSEILEMCFEIIKNRIASPTPLSLMSDNSAANVVRLILISIFGDQNSSIKAVIEELNNEFK